MDKVYAIIEDGKVVNRIVWDGIVEWAPSKDPKKLIIDISHMPEVDIGDDHKGGDKFEKPVVDPVEPSPDPGP